MLILSRKAGEAIYIDTPSGERIVVWVREIDRRREQVRIGVEARRDVTIWRGELHEQATGEGE